METDLKTRDDIAALLDAHNSRRVYVAVCDLQGQLRGKSVSREKFEAWLDKGFPVPPILPAMDFTDVVYPVPLHEAAERLGDGLARVIPETWRAIPWEAADAGLLFLGEMTGAGAAFDPRVIYRRVESSAREQGLVPLHACELECTLLRETHESVHDKGFRDLQLLTRDAGLYGLARHSARSEFFSDLATLMEHMTIPLDACHWELSPGAVEIVMRREQGVRAADNAAIYKTFARSFAQRRGMLMTFMARLSHETAGHSGHVHVSLLDRHGAPVFHDARREDNLGAPLLQFVGGLQTLLPEFMLMLLPNVNSWRRMEESAWSFDPRWCLWGIDNRSVPLRVMPGGPGELHLEVRIPGADANPYLALACVVAAGLYGLEQELEPTAPAEGNAFRGGRRWPRRIALPQTFTEAIERFRGSRSAAGMFGAEFVRVFSETRACQEREFRGRVSEWELRRFLESA